MVRIGCGTLPWNTLEHLGTSCNSSSPCAQWFYGTSYGAFRSCERFPSKCQLVYSVYESFIFYFFDSLMFRWFRACQRLSESSRFSSRLSADAGSFDSRNAVPGFHFSLPCFSSANHECKFQIGMLRSREKGVEEDDVWHIRHGWRIAVLGKAPSGMRLHLMLAFWLTLKCTKPERPRMSAHLRWTGDTNLSWFQFIATRQSLNPQAWLMSAEKGVSLTHCFAQCGLIFQSWEQMYVKGNVKRRPGSPIVGWPRKSQPKSRSTTINGWQRGTWRTRQRQSDLIWFDLLCWPCEWPSSPSVEISRKWSDDQNMPDVYESAAGQGIGKFVAHVQMFCTIKIIRFFFMIWCRIRHLLLPPSYSREPACEHICQHHFAISDHQRRRNHLVLGLVWAIMWIRHSLGVSEFNFPEENRKPWADALSKCKWLCLNLFYGVMSRYFARYGYPE
jgi:hypothetical protein